MREVVVKTICGDTHHLHIDQDVKSIEVNGVTYVSTEENKIDDITELRNVRFKDVSRSFGAMSGAYVVRIKKEDGNIIIPGCSVLEHMWSHLVEHCKR